MSDFHRVILVSDMHYTTDETEQEMKKKWPQAKPSAAAGDAFGMTQKEKIQCVYQDILGFHQTHPVSA